MRREVAVANKLAEGAVARVEQIGGLLEKVVGKVIGSERLQERGQEHIEHASTAREEAQADAPNAEPAEDGGADGIDRQPRASAPQDGQAVGVWDPSRQHHRRRYGL
jgi:hypothetical protein